MNIQVNRHQLERVVIKWLNKNFGNLTTKKHKDYPKSVFYVNSDNQVMMKYNQKNGYVYIHNDHIWSKIESLFHLNYDDTQSIMKVWLEEAYKLGGVTPFNADVRLELEEDYKLKNRI
jgi:hypothetical protein